MRWEPDVEHWIEHLPEPSRLLLAWQAPHDTDRFRWAVAECTRHDGQVSLRYFQAGAEFEAINQGRTLAQLQATPYSGYPAFSPKQPIHGSGVLEALMRRIPPRSRRDFIDYRRRFRLSDTVDPSDFALLGLAEAKLQSDGFSIVNPLDRTTDLCDLLLEVAGYRHYARHGPAVAPGDRVALVAEPGNRFDPNAISVAESGRTLGYINRLQSAAFHAWLNTRHVDAWIERLNGSLDRPRLYIFVRVRPSLMQAA